MERQSATWATLSGDARCFFAAVPCLAVVLGALAATLAPWAPTVWPRLLLWTLIAIAGHAGEFELTRRNGQRIFMSAGFAVSVAAIADLPPLAAMIAVAVGSLTWNELQSGVPLYAILFNRGTLALCALVGNIVYQTAAVWAPHGVAPFAVCTLLAALAYFSLNVTLVSVATGLRLRRPVVRAWFWPFGHSPLLLGNYLALGLIGDLLLITEHRVGEIGLLLAFVPLAMSYASLRQLAVARVMHRALLSSLVDSLDLRDSDTGGHTRHVASLAVRLGAKLRVKGRALEDLYAAALLHDLGKIGIPDDILRKPSSLNEAEWRLMRRHPDLGAELLRTHPGLRGAVPLVRHHQEHYDGTGYPAGLQGHAIPLGLRIITVADSVMAMVDGRPYRLPKSPKEALDELRRCAGTHFDPAVVDAFVLDDLQVALSETVE